MRIETDETVPTSVYLMLNAADIDGMIEKLRLLKAKKCGHFDIFFTGAEKTAIANIEISYADRGEDNFSMDPKTDGGEA